MRKNILALISIIITFTACQSMQETPEEVINKYFLFYKNFFNTIYDTDNSKLSNLVEYSKELNIELKSFSTYRFFENQAQFINSIGRIDFYNIYNKENKKLSYMNEEISEDTLLGLIISQQISSNLNHLANSEIQKIESIKKDSQKIIISLIVITSHHTYGKPKMTLNEHIEFWKIKNMNKIELENQIQYNEEVATGKGWTFNYETLEKHIFILIKEENKLKIDDFKYEILESKINSSYFSTK